MRDAIALEGPFDDIKNAITASRQRKEVDIKMRRIHPKFNRAALKGDWDIAKNYISATISNEGDTALHIAAALPHSMLGIKLVEEMHTEDLVTRNNAGNTALFPAAASGNLKLAKKMLEKNGNLALIRGGKNELPIYMAAVNGHREMIRYLYEATRDHLNSEDLIELLIALIKISLFDIAQDLVKEHPEIATLHDKNEKTALHCLARMPLIIDKQGTSGILYFTTGS